MCGIFGIVNPQQAGIESSHARRCLDYLAVRGPDDAGWYEADGIMLGHRRLSIMDLSAAGRQPMSNEDGTDCVSFNGEIYGFWKLRSELEGLGHVFRSTCDTEVIVHGYEEWGRGLLQRIDGMFAFGVWDEKTRSLLLARDRLGKKPLFVSRRGNMLAFSSQIRPLVASGIAAPCVRPDALREYLFLNYIIGPKTIFKDVELLPAGGWMEVKGGKEESGCYWSLASVGPDAHVDSQSRFEAILLRSTRERMVSDAPMGIFLSGGVDSAVIAAIAKREAGGKQSTFSVGFDDPAYDERPKALRVARHLGTDHHEVVCHAGDVPDILPKLTASADHLLADQAMVPLAKLAIEAKQSVKTVLTGDGGDELLAGYDTYRALKIASYYIKVIPERIRAKIPRIADYLPARPEKMARSMLLSRFLNATTDGLAQAHASWRSIWSHTEIDALFSGRHSQVVEWKAYAERMERRNGWNLLQSAVYSDISTWLVDSILAKVDRSTMLTGLEARSPLLDSQLMEFSFATLLADERNASKLPLRRFAESLLGPVLATVKKEGFQAPFAAWFAGPLRPYARDSLATLRENLPGVFDERMIGRIETEHASRSKNHDLKLWSLVVLGEWSKLYPELRMAEES